MFDVWETTANLRQPCLVRSPTSAALDHDGVVRNSVLKSIDHLLWEFVEHDLLDSSGSIFSADCEYTADKWLTTSALQKCIRRGHVDLAVRYARSGVRIDPEHTFKRLAIIALEDVGLGDLRLVAASLAVLGDKRRRSSLGAERLGGWLAARMSMAPKSRSACELLSLVEYQPAPHFAEESSLEVSGLDLNSVLATADPCSSEQMAALWLLCGTSRLKSRSLPSVKGGGSHALLKVLSGRRAPLIFHYLVQRGLSRSRDTLAIPYGLLADEGHSLNIKKANISEPTMIGQYPSFAYDIHTRVGRFAIARLEEQFVDCLRAAGVQNVGNLIFAIEGGVLNRRVTNTILDRVSAQAATAEIFGTDGNLSEVRRLKDCLSHQLDTIRGQVAVSR